MKHKMAVITDQAGNFLGAMRTEVKAGQNTISFLTQPDSNHQRHTIEVDEELMHKPIDEVRKVLLNEIGKR